MERLTKRTVMGIVGNNASIENYPLYKVAQYDKLDRGITGQCFDKLAEYEDLEEQGLLLRLPCHIGDTVWDNDYGKPCAYTITGFSFGTCEDYIDEPVSLKEVVYYYSNYSGSITGSFAVSEIGKTIFLTQVAAEKKLKEMESDGYDD